jgi:hypothetical protein
MLCWRANRPQGSDLTDYINRLGLGLVEPVGMQLYYMFVDQPTSVQQIGPFNGTSFAPSFLPVKSSSNSDVFPGLFVKSCFPKKKG